jgi:glycogen operon protein
MAGHSNMITGVATRIAGSSDLYLASSRGPLSSINFITSHDGFTLYDLVSYDHKHNLGNGEKNSDGDNHNISWNSGHEGAPAPAAVERLRRRRMCSMLTILMLSQGVPMLTAGDEIGRSQQGNNNAWCQDNKVSWLDWKLIEKNHGLLRFFRQCIELRRRHPIFRREDFFYTADSTLRNAAVEEISWQYLTPGSQNWGSACHGLGVLLHGLRQNLPRDDDFFIMLNGHISESLSFIPPPVPTNIENRSWHLIIDTSDDPPQNIQLQGRLLDPSEELVITVPPFTVKVLQSMPIRQ